MPRKKAEETDVIEDAQVLEHPPDEATAVETPPGPAPPEEPPRPRRARAPKKAEPPGEVAVAHSVPARQNSAAGNRPSQARDAPVLTIEAGGSIETSEDRAEQVWHEVRNALRTKKILTGTLSGMERGDNSVIAIVDYKGLRVAIPLSEMMINLAEDGGQRGEMLLRQSKILGNSLGAEIDFIVKGIDAKTRSVVASRREAMLKKRLLFYYAAAGQPRVHEGRVVQARVIAVAEKVARVEIFGVECAILARDLSHDWIGDARDRYHVGDELLVRVLEIQRESVEELRVRADVKSVAGDDARDNLQKCKAQGKYAGTVTDVRRGSVFLRLNVGVNAIAHSCYDNRMPGKKDEVSFVVTHLDRERNVAMGIITRIIKQNL